MKTIKDEKELFFCVICGEEYELDDLYDTEEVLNGGGIGLVCEDCLPIAKER